MKSESRPCLADCYYQHYILGIVIVEIICSDVAYVVQFSFQIVFYL